MELHRGTVADAETESQMRATILTCEFNLLDYIKVMLGCLSWPLSAEWNFFFALQQMRRMPAANRGPD
jgi:hypothetical protein